MKYIKMLGLLAIAAAALMAFTGVASATTVTAPAGTPYTGKIHASSTNSTLHNAVGTIKCNSTVEGTVKTHGAGVTAKGPISTLHFNACENGSVHTGGVVATPGEIEVHNIAGTKNATVTSTGAKVTITMFGVECGYTTANTHIGEITAAPTATGHGTFHIKGNIPRTHGSAFCGSSGNWTGTYKINTPTGISFS